MVNMDCECLGIIKNTLIIITLPLHACIYITYHFVNANTMRNLRVLISFSIACLLIIAQDFTSHLWFNFTWNSSQQARYVVKEAFALLVITCITLRKCSLQRGTNQWSEGRQYTQCSMLIFEHPGIYFTGNTWTGMGIMPISEENKKQYNVEYTYTMVCLWYRKILFMLINTSSDIYIW